MHPTIQQGMLLYTLHVSQPCPPTLITLITQAEKYGLSFVNLHSPPDSSSAEVATTSTQSSKLGGFSLKEETKDLPTGSLFYKKDRPPATTSSPLSMAGQARLASSQAVRNVQLDSVSKKTRESTSKTTHLRPIKRRLESGSPTSSPPKKAKGTHGLLNCRH